MLNVEQFKKYIVIPTLTRLKMNSSKAVNLMLGTAAQESQLTYIHQLNDGPALGVFQVEPFTANDVYDNWLAYRPEIRDRVNEFIGLSHIEKPYPQYMKEMLIANLKFGCAITRCNFYRREEPLPAEDDVEGMARYWKKYHNTSIGKGTEEEFIKHYNELVKGK